MSVISCSIFVFSIFVIGVYVFPELGDVDDGDVEFTLLDLILLLAAIGYFFWFIYTYAHTFLG